MLSASSPFSIVIFGASGHLAKIKLYPALYVLALKKRLPKDYSVVGFSRSSMDTESFRTVVEESIRKEMLEVTESALKEFLEHVHYHQGQYDQTEDFSELSKKLSGLEKSWDSTVRLAYFSIPPSVYTDVAENLCKGNVHDEKIPFRCIVEKPVGTDMKSFEQVRDLLLGCFKEEEIYLLDHYLGKEAVRNVYYLRYANPVIERIFKNTLIHHVEITVTESKGLSGRAGYFEAVGTLRDMFQSHMLMMGSLLTMRLQSEEDFSESRRNALEQFYLPPAKDMDDLVLQAQYTAGTVDSEKVPGYVEEDGIEKGSRTNTYACLKVATRMSRWEGVPFYLRSGKRLEKKETRISIAFQEPTSPGKGSSPNRMDFILQGEAGMRMHLQTKMGGTEPEFRPLVLDDPLVCVGDCLPEHSLLLLEAAAGKKQWFLSFSEAQTAWRLIDPLQAHLDKSDTPLRTYKAGSEGPEAAEKWIEKDGIEWV